MNHVELKFNVYVNGRNWQLFSVDFVTADGKYSTYIYALSAEHAEMIVSELKETAHCSGQVLGWQKAEGN